jgi:hypothetical protein
MKPKFIYIERDNELLIDDDRFEFNRLQVHVPHVLETVPEDALD